MVDRDNVFIRPFILQEISKIFTTSRENTSMSLESLTVYWECDVAVWTSLKRPENVKIVHLSIVRQIQV